MTRILCYPRSRSLLIELLGGEGMAEWIHLIQHLEVYAREQGCRHVEVQGRRGWERALAGEGYTFMRQMLEKEI